MKFRLDMRVLSEMTPKEIAVRYLKRLIWLTAIMLLPLVVVYCQVIFKG